MGIADQFKDKAQELADQAKQAKQRKQGDQGAQRDPGARVAAGAPDEASERMRRAREDRDLGVGDDMLLDDERDAGQERYR
ncbi:hypothetical protein [Streptomyces albidochromogenes]|uniref:Antitoxin n=1 Tax=Streptomyces albidochromogenes TaxID=329524 RepID=A0ABW6FLZ0_9ACTN|nr:hypothetical protein [Streptomyces albidochromogenes]